MTYKHSPIEKADVAFPPAYRPGENSKRPWAVDYRNATRFDGTKSKAGTLYFEGAAEATAWRAAVLAPPKLSSPF